MKITPHNPVERYLASDFAQTELFQFLDALKAFLNEMDWDSFATKEELQVVATKVDELEDEIDHIADTVDHLGDDVDNLGDAVNTINTTITTINGAISDLSDALAALRVALLARIEAIEAQLNESITVVQAVFTNPSYFYADSQDAENYSVAASDKAVVASFTGSVLQAVQVADDTLEVVNIQLDDNVNLDLSKTPNHFYTPIAIEHFDSQGNFTDMQTCILDCEISQEMSGYDISCYFHGNISNVNQYTKFHFSLDYPYFVRRGE